MIYVYKASAGSGKTFTLVRQYLKLLLGKKQTNGEYRLNEKPGLAHRSILAITFTNKATNEMKSRIIQELDTLRDKNAKQVHMDYLTAELHTTPEKIHAAAEIALKGLLHDYTNFNVSTIDTFFQLILRTFAYESELSYNYNVELSLEYVASVGISDLKQSLQLKSKDKDVQLLINWLEEFMMEKIRKGNSWNIFNQSTDSYGTTLYSFAKNLSNEKVQQNQERLEYFLQNKSKITEFCKLLKKKEDEEWRNVIQNVDKFNAITADFKFFRNINPVAPLARQRTDGLDKKKQESAFSKIGNEEKMFTQKVWNSGAEEKSGAMRQCLEELRESFAKLNSYSLITDQLYYLGLLGDIQSNIRQFTADNNLVMLSDTNEMLKKIISEDDAPFIYERVGVRLEHFLIDEFQDTSQMQWENMRPLVLNSLASDNDSLIIGDVKQSIYRFRNSDPRLLKEQIYRDFPKESVVSQGDDIESNTNWRSSRHVIQWNNTFFTILADMLGMQDIYSNVIQKVAEKNWDNLGHVRIEKLDKPAKGEIKPGLVRMIDDIYSLLDRGYSQKDITILVNRNTEGEMVISHLLKHNEENQDPDKAILSVVSEESLLIKNSPAVKIIVSILAELDNSIDKPDADNKSLLAGKNLALIRSRFNYYANNDTTKSTSEAFEAALMETTAIDSKALLSSGDCAGLDAIVDHIINAYIPEDMRRENTAYIQAFQDSVIAYMGNYGSNLHMFLKWWEEVKKKRSISSSDDIDAIKVMTIHKSKGLEFPCVIIPFCEWEFDKGGQEWISQTAELADALGIKDPDKIPPILPVKRSGDYENLFKKEFDELKHDSVMDSLNKTYVAFTRAANELIVYFEGSESKITEIKTMPHALMSAFGATEIAVNTLLRNNALRVKDKNNGKSVDEIVAIYNNLTITPANYFSNGIFELGTPTEKKKKGNEAPAENRRYTMPSYEVINRPEIWQFDLPDLIMEQRDSQQYRGIVLHNIMRKIHVASDKNHVIRTFKERGLINSEEMKEFDEIITRGLSLPDAAVWFQKGNKLLQERTIVNSEGKEYRPDRVVKTPDGRTIIIDYKFGEAESKKYISQVKNYMNIISKAIPGCKPEGYVWYVTEGKIIPVNN